MENKVTIIVPVYNVKQYLKECVDSLTGQTYRYLEILLVDDGSTDSSGLLCDQFAKEDDRIRVIHQENGGAGSARNKGMDEATGEFIMFLDADDWLDADAVETLVQYAQEHRTDVVRFTYVREYPDRKLVKKNTFLDERVYTQEECAQVRRQILGLTGEEWKHPENMNYLASCCFNLYRRELLLASGERFESLQRLGSFEDGLFNFGVFEIVKRFAYLDKPFYHYRKTNVSAATAGYRRDYLARQLLLFEYLKNRIQSDGQWEALQEACYNRIVHATMEICFNAMRNKAPSSVRYREINEVVHHPVFTEAYRRFSLKALSFKWKVYFFFIKHAMTLPVYWMTAIILKLKNRGTA